MKTAIGILPLLLGIPSYIFYVYSVHKGETVPHVYSWLIWAVLAGIGFIAQVSASAGPGSWNTGFTALVCFIVFLVSLKYGERQVSKLDVTLLFIAFLAIIARLIIGNYVATVLLTTGAALIGFVFSIKKAYKRPGQENSATFALNGVRSLISLFALTTVSFTTFFCPFCMMFANFSVVAAIFSGRKSQK